MAPRIPIYQSQVGLGALPGVRRDTSVNPQAFDSAGVAGLNKLAGTLGQSGDEMFRAATIEKQREDTLFVKDSYVKASDEIRQTMNGDIYQRKGLNTQDSVKDTDEVFRTTYDKYATSMSDKQKARFDQFWFSLRNSTMGTVSGYRRRELAKAEDSRDLALIEGASNDAAAVYNNPAEIDRNAGIIQTTLQSTSNRHGWTQEVFNRRLEAANTQLYSGAVRRAMSQEDLVTAEGILKTHGGKIVPEVRDNLETTLKSRVLLKEVQTEADLLTAKYPINQEDSKYKDAQGTTYTGEEAALKQAEEQFEGRKERELKNEIKVRYSDMRRTDNQRTQQQLDGLTKQMIETDTYSEAVTLAKKMSDGPTQLTLLNLAHSLHPEEMQTRKTIRSIQNLGVRDSLMARIDNQEFSGEMGILRAAADHRLPKELTDETVKYFKNGGRAKGLTRARLDGIIKLYDSQGLGAHPEIWDYVLDHAPEGKAFTDDVIRQLVAPVLKEKGESTSNWILPDRNKTYAQALAEGSADAWLPFVTTDEKAEIAEILVKQGKPVNYSEMQKYKKYEIMGVPKPSTGDR